MTEQSTTANAVETPDANAPEQSVEAPTLTLEQAQEQMARLEATNQRLLDESRKYKVEAKTLKQEKETKTKAMLEEQGRYKEMYSVLDEEHRSLKETVIREKVRSAVTAVAAKTGCHNIDLLLKAGNAELLQYDDASHHVDGADLFVEDVRKAHPYLFSTGKAPSLNVAAPSGMATAPKPITAQDTAKMTKAQQAAVLANLLK